MARFAHLNNNHAFERWTHTGHVFIMRLFFLRYLHKGLQAVPKILVIVDPPPALPPEVMFFLFL